MMTASPGWSVNFSRCRACCKSSRGDLVAVGQHLRALQRRDVDQDATGHQRADVLDAQLAEARARRNLRKAETVVEPIPDRLMAEPVELRPDLPQLGEDDLFVAAAMIEARIDVGAFGEKVEAPSGKEGHGRRQHVAELEDLASLDQSCCAHDGVRTHVVARAALVLRPPFRRTARGFGRRLPRLCGSRARSAGPGPRRRAKKYASTSSELIGTLRPCVEQSVSYGSGAPA